MMADLHLVTGSILVGKTAHLSEVYCRGARSAPGTTLWLCASPRLVEAVRELLLDRLGGGWGIRVSTLDRLAEEVVRQNDPQVQVISQAQQRLLLEEVLAELNARGELPHFRRLLESRGLTQALLVLVAELKRACIRPFELARACYRRGQDGPQIARQIRQQGISHKDRECVRIFARYQRELHQKSLLDRDGLPARACELLGEGLLFPFENVRTVILDGFVDLDPSQLELLRALGRHLDEIWISLPDEEGELRGELFTLPRRTAARLLGLQAGARRVEVQAPQTLAGPPELAHLRRQLFRPIQAVEQQAGGAGILVIEGPGMLGEARLAAREIRQLLQRGVHPEEVLVTLRDLSRYADLLREVFAEYELPFHIEGQEPLARSPAVSVLLRALRLPEDDWPFADATALLRSTYLCPEWEETCGQPDLPQQAEALLRLLREPRGRDAYLLAARRWAERLQPGLEDEQAEEHKRFRTHQLAQRCLPFLERFFQAWGDAPAHAPLAQHLGWLRGFADDLGICRAAGGSAQDAQAVERLWSECDAWLAREASRPAREQGRPLDRKTFLHRLAALASTASLPRGEEGRGRVRVVAAEEARHLRVPYLFVMGLAERSFPRLGSPQAFFDEQDWQSFREQGVAHAPAAADQLPAEMLLFFQVVTRAEKRLVLSYPAVDERGQELLPSSFLSAVRGCYLPDSLPVLSRRLLIQGFLTDPALSAAELRAQLVSRRLLHGKEAACLAGGDLLANLRDAAALSYTRFHTPDYSAYEGMFQDADLASEVAALFGPERILSPTALEDYVACPFRFFLRHVLRLEPLDEPREEIEVTRRGQAFHRALARLHRRRKQAGAHHPDEEVRAQVLEEIRASVAEDVGRAPSPAAKQLWQLEGERLLRHAEVYPEHWERLIQPWKEHKLLPRPHFFEVDFGLKPAEGEEPHDPLVIRMGGVEARISGRIDRVDVVELSDGIGYWIIDYKTGRAGSYTGPDLQQYRKLQLTLYALAVEEVLLAGRGARPLGLAYWLVTDQGPKVVLPGGRKPALWLEETGQWRQIREQLQQWIVTLVSNIRRGVYPLRPRSEHCTLTCPYGQVCRITQARSICKSWDLPLPGGDQADSPGEP